MGLRIVVGADSAGYDYKETLKADFEASDLVDEVTDMGVDEGGATHYPHIAVAAAQRIVDGKADRALLVCGTGMGVAISARSDERRVGTTGRWGERDDH